MDLLEEFLRFLSCHMFGRGGLGDINCFPFDVAFVAKEVYLIAASAYFLVNFDDDGFLSGYGRIPHCIS